MMGNLELARIQIIYNSRILNRILLILINLSRYTQVLVVLIIVIERYRENKGVHILFGKLLSCVYLYIFNVSQCLKNNQERIQINRNQKSRNSYTTTND